MNTSRFAEDIYCPKCKQVFDDNSNTASTSSSSSQLRVPVKLIPCSHTVCRPCVRFHFSQLQASAMSHHQQQQIEPQCPLCSTKIEVTQFDEAVLTLVRSAQIELLAQQQQQHNHHQTFSSNSSYDPNYFTSAASAYNPEAYRLPGSSSSSSSFATAVAVSSAGPLNPQLRQEILAKVTRQEDAPKAEQVARGIGSLKRSIDFSKTEFDTAREERDAANETVETKQTVVTSLQNELKSLDEKIKQMNLDRQVILLQLHSAISEQSNSAKYRTECEMRLLEIQRKIQAEATELENRINVIQQLAPGVNLY